jgi:hypothetical protein
MTILEHIAAAEWFTGRKGWAALSLPKNDPARRLFQGSKKQARLARGDRR